MRIILTLTAFLISFVLYSQNSENNELKNLKITALSMLINEYFTFNKNINNENFKNNIIYIIDENLTAIDIERIESPMIIKSIDIYDKKNKKKLKKGINAWRIGLTLNEDIIIISFNYFWLEYKNHKYSFINQGVSNVYFKISCKEKKWELIDK